MNKVLKCRRTFLAALGIICLFVLGLRGIDVASSLATIVLGVAAANAGEAAVSRNRKENENK